MLNSIEIRNFKRIQDERNADGSVKTENPLILDKLAPVNYLVGQNGSGKSSVLEILSSFYEFENHQKKTAITLGMTTSKSNGLMFMVNPGTNKAILKIDSDDFEIKIHTKQDNDTLVSKIEDNTLTIKPERNHQSFLSKFIILDLLPQKDIYRSYKYFSEKTLEIIRSIGQNDTGCYRQKFEELRMLLDITIQHPFELPDRPNIINDIMVFGHDMNFYSEGEKWILALITNLLWIDNLKTDHRIILLIDEVENSLHPRYQKLIPRVLSHFREIQFLMTTHSPFIISAALRQDNQKVFHIENGQTKNSYDKQKIEKEGVGDFDLTLKDLGFEMKDIFYPNCLIYVEGSSDIIYIQSLLQLYQNQKSNQFYKGVDYDFVEYGGTLASHLTFDPVFKVANVDFTSKNVTEKLVNMFNLSRNIFFLTDGDYSKSSKFEPAKNRIQELANDYPGLQFFKEPQKNGINTFENYLDNGLFNQLNGRTKTDKAVDFAKKIEGMKWKDFCSQNNNKHLKKLIKKIYTFVQSHNH